MKLRIIDGWLLPGLVAGAVALGTAILVAVVFAVADIYVTGHGGKSLMQPWVTWGSVVALSPADVVLDAAVLVAGTATFLLARRRQT